MEDKHLEGEVFGRYRLVRRLAVGGMAEVYLAMLQGEAGFEKRVVIKKILPVFSGDKAFVERLIREGKLVARLSHGNIVQVLELGQVSGEHFLALEYVEGRDLRELISSLRDAGIQVPQPLAAHILHRIARALGYAHTRTDEGGVPLRVVHRDVSPANVMLSWEGEIKLTDFGIARSIDSSTLAQGTLQGKVPYMSPEQTEGLEPGPESDIFSLGVLAYELLTGARPFDGDTDGKTISRIRSGSRAPLAQVRPDLTRGFCEIVDRCLARLPHERFAGGAELEAALRSLMAENGWVVGSADVAETMALAFPREGGVRRGDDPITGHKTSTASTNPGPATRSIVVPPTRPTRRIVLLALMLLVMIGITGFGLAMVLDWHRNRASTPGDRAEESAIENAPVPDRTRDLLQDAREPRPGPEQPDATGAPDRDLREPAPEDGAPNQAPDQQEVLQDVLSAAPETVPEGEVRGEALDLHDVATAQPSDGQSLPDVPRAGDTAELTQDQHKHPDAQPQPTEIKDEKPPRQGQDRPEPREEEKPRATATRLTVAPESASILVDGKKVGTGSCVLKLEPDQEVLVRLEGEGLRTEEFRLKHPGPRRLSKSIESDERGTLSVRYFPAAATLFLDDKQVSSGSGMNIVKLEVPAGMHTLQLTGPDGRTLRKKVQVPAGGTTGITLEVD